MRSTVVILRPGPFVPIVFFALTVLSIACVDDVQSARLNPPHARLQSPYGESICSPSCLYVGNKGGDQPVPGPPPTGWTIQSPLIVALIWTSIIAVIATVVVYFIRFYGRHNEHPVIDDRPSSEIWERGLHNYLRLMRKEEDEENEARSP
ncbi:MAG TPA: hypothetical protein VNA15_02975 [Candidatus Angelobacter sp.]|nr:hypothetical protein [Candidatus Angelobacter sp.]